MQVAADLPSADALHGDEVQHDESGSPSKLRVKRTSPQHHASKYQIAGTVYNWCVWLFIVFLIFSQFLGIFWNTVETKQHLLYGEDPRKGSKTVDGYNDEPYTDRVIACVEDGRFYRAVQVSEQISSGSAKVVDTTGTSVNGYRLVERQGFTIDPTIIDFYTGVCTLIASTITPISDFCERVGYNITKDDLRVVNGLQSKTTHVIPKSLPLVIMPYWDNGMFARYAIPGNDGSACMFRLLGKYEDLTRSVGVFRAVNRTVREKRTAELLNQFGGVWRNGWYEDLVGEKWYSDPICTDLKSVYEMPMREFDALADKEQDCANTNACEEFPVVDHWGAKFVTTNYALSTSSVTVSNGNRFGLFLYERFALHVVKSTYDWETLVSNVSVATLLLRWLEAMFALQYGYYRGQSSWHNTGIGCLSNARIFILLPIALLPKMKMTLGAFWTLGCEVEGTQKAFSDAWYTIYPAIVELMLFYFSVLNIIAKYLRRRMPDYFFGPSVLFFCLMHRYRTSIAQSGWFGIDGRVPGLVLDSEVDDLGILQFLSTDAPFRMNGNVKSLIAIKLVVLALNLLPLLLSRRLATEKMTNTQVLGIEAALAVRCFTIGGLGKRVIYEGELGAKYAVHVSGRSLSSYELVRLGYVVFGDKYLISIEDWEMVTAMPLLRSIYHLWNKRVVLFTVTSDNGVMTVSATPELCRLDDPRLQKVRFWRMTGCPTK